MTDSSFFECLEKRYIHFKNYYYYEKGHIWSQSGVKLFYRHY